MNEDFKQENINSFFLDSFSLFENSFESLPNKQHNLYYQDFNKERQKKNNTDIFNINLNYKVQNLNQNKNYDEAHKFEIKNSNSIS